MTRRVVILGSAGPSNRWANELTDDIELWGTNLTHRFLTRPCQRYFQMHHRMHNAESGHPPGHFGRPLDHEEFLRTCGIPVIMQEQDALIPTSEAYPLAEISARFAPYFTSTIPYMIAMALYEGVDEIGLLGIYLSSSVEYREHRPCVEYWLGIARALGVNVELADGCGLTNAPLYAYSEVVPGEPIGDRLRLTRAEVLA